MTLEMCSLLVSVLTSSTSPLHVSVVVIVISTQQDGSQLLSQAHEVGFIFSAAHRNLKITIKAWEWQTNLSVMPHGCWQ
jgi:hypothetical protein